MGTETGAKEKRFEIKIVRTTGKGETAKKEDLTEQTKVLLIGFVGILAVVAAYFGFRALGLGNGLVINIVGIPTEITIASIGMAILFWTDGNIYIRRHQLGMGSRSYALAGLIVAIAVILSVVVHEFAHGIVSQLFGNPITQAGITGWGAYVAPSETILEVSPIQEILVGFAGPASNIMLALVAYRLVLRMPESLLENSIQYLGVINMRLAKLNLFPIILLLDGGKMVHGLVRMVGITEYTVVWQLVIGIFLYSIVWKRIWRKRHPVTLEQRFEKA